MKFNILIKSVFFLLILSKISIAECVNFEPDTFSKNIKSIEIKIDNERGFLTEISRKLINFHKEDYEGFDRKKKYKSKVIVNYEDGATCNFRSTIRAHGDQADHIDLIDGTPTSSLRVNLREGNIRNITKFILYRPKSRNSDNEVFVSTLLNNLGFLSPRSFYVDIKVSGKINKYIFQENLKKEFLEYNNKIEGPIIESNEDFWSGYKILQMSRVSNKEWIKSENSNLMSTIDAMYKYNKVLLHSYNYTTNVRKDHILRIKENFFLKSEYENISIFDALMFALDCWHGLTFDDRRFYYDPIYSIFEPIYYDGMSRILSKIGYNVKTERYEIQLGRGLGPQLLIYNDDDIRPSTYINYVSDSAIYGSSEAINKIKNLNKKKLLDDLIKNGLTNFDESKIDLLLNFIIERLNLIKNANISKFNEAVEGNIYTKYEENMNGLDKDKYLIFLNKKDGDKFEIEICSFDLNNCQILMINKDEIKFLLEQKHFKDKYTVFLALPKSDYINGDLIKKSGIFNNKFKTIQLDDQINIAHSNNVKINFDKDKRELNINFLSNQARLVIYKSNLIDLTINMENSSQTKNTFSKKINSLTGCLTIIDSKIKNLSVTGSNFYCEDTLNFIRAKGDLKNVKINNAISDGVDADFSFLNIQNISVREAFNDCADFSYGKYNITNSEFIKCGDKAASVGEKSQINLKKLLVSNSNTGIASKDSSKVDVKDAIIKEVRECFAAYNKKQEFDGAFINVQNSSCTNFYKKSIQDKLSSIKIFNE